ncbi:hypothetical protein GO496_08175 [Acidovorax citrulli]|nr:hypothetical protein [Paracidovorax citrulli]
MASRLTTPEDAARVLYHEVAGHPRACGALRSGVGQDPEPGGHHAPR